MGLFRAFHPNRRPIPVRGCIAGGRSTDRQVGELLTRESSEEFGIVLACL
jgi:hypothetical protein